jgi:FkbM family methyltransferase
MGSAYTFVKNRALTILPEVILRPLRAWHYRRVLRSFTDADEPDLRVVRELVQRGTTAIDLGANIGIYTKVLSDLVGPTGIVISVEPVPQTYAILSRNVKSLAMTNVACVNAAISDTDGKLVMMLPEYDTGGTNFYQARVVATRNQIPADSKRYIQVRAVRLDTLTAGAAAVSFVKCDVEGHEMACLSGAEMILTSHRPAWLIEVSGDPDAEGTSAKKLFELFAGHSYVPYWFDRHKLIERQPGDRSINYFFLKPEHLARLRKNALAKVDRASLAVSLEARVPLLDHRVVEFAWRLKPDQKVRDGKGKWLLRQVLYALVDRNLVDRPKVGFSVPIGDWLRGPLRSWAEDLLFAGTAESEKLLQLGKTRPGWGRLQSGDDDAALAFWAVLMFESWRRRWVH